MLGYVCAVLGARQCLWATVPVARALLLGRIWWQLGYVRMVYGALNGERQCSWAAVPDCLVRFSWREYCGSWVTFAWRFALSSLRSLFVGCRAELLVPVVMQIC